MPFPEQLKYYREKHHLSQRKLAKELALSPSLIAMYENGLRKPSFEKLCAIGDYFNIPIDDLVADQSEVSMPEQLPPSQSEAVETEKRLLQAWREADPLYQRVALEMLETHKRGESTP